MLCGDRDLFAIEFEIRHVGHYWVYGRFFFWVNGKKYGDPDDSVHMEGCRGWCEEFAERSGNNVNDEYFSMSVAELDRELGSYISCATDEYYVDYLGMSSFDRGREIFLLIRNGNGEERLLWRTMTEPMQDVLLGVGVFNVVLRQFVEEYDRILSSMRENSKNSPE